jgi:hypothetical protein
MDVARAHRVRSEGGCGCRNDELLASSASDGSDEVATPRGGEVMRRDEDIEQKEFASA